MYAVRIRIRPDKNGKLVAHYWGRALRWLPLPLAEAQAALEAGTWKGKVAVPATC